MTKRTTTVGAAALISLGLAAGAGIAPADAHGGHGQFAGVQGVVTDVTAGALQIQTASGSVTVPYTSTTRVIKDVAGSTSDLVANARVELKLNSGTTTATAVTVEPAFTKPATAGTAPSGTHPTHRHATSTGPAATASSTATTKPAHTWTGARTHAGGQIVSFSNGTLTLKGRGGQTATYTLASGATITKIASGTTADLAKGETVVAFAPSGGAARFIAILNG